MTTETERRVPEHPGWQPWWIRYAEYEGILAVLVDRELVPAAHVGTGKRYAVGIASVDSRGPCWCGSGECAAGAYYWRSGSGFSDLAEAEAAFELACERLREGA